MSSEWKRQKRLAGAWQTTMIRYLARKIDKFLIFTVLLVIYFVYVFFTFGRHHNGDYGNVEPAQTLEGDQNPAQHKL
jgi:hypothetical protein